MAVDTQRLVPTLSRINYLWVCPVLVLFITILLWQQLGPSSLAGLAVLLVVLPFNTTFLAKRLKHLQVRTYTVSLIFMSTHNYFPDNLPFYVTYLFQKKQMEIKDKRLKLTGQVLNGIKVRSYNASLPIVIVIYQYMNDC